MGCLHIVLGDRFNYQLQEIYRRGFRFLLSQMGQIYDSIVEAESHQLVVKDIKNSENGKEERKGRSLTPEAELPKEISGDLNERLQQMNVYAAKYQ